MKVYVVKYGHFEGDDPLGVFTSKVIAKNISAEHPGTEIFEMELDKHTEAYRKGFRPFILYDRWRDSRSWTPATKVCTCPFYPDELEFTVLPKVLRDPVWFDDHRRRHGGTRWAYVWAFTEEQAFEKLSAVLDPGGS